MLLSYIRGDFVYCPFLLVLSISPTRQILILLVILILSHFGTLIQYSLLSSFQEPITNFQSIIMYPENMLAAVSHVNRDLFPRLVVQIPLFQHGHGVFADLSHRHGLPPFIFRNNLYNMFCSRKYYITTYSGLQDILAKKHFRTGSPAQADFIQKE